MEGSEPAPAGALSDAGAGAEAAGLRGGRAEALAATSPAAAAPATLNQIRYPALMNMDYHAAREAWLDQLHRWLMFSIVVSGAVALVDVWPWVRAAGPAVAVVCGALDLTFDLSNRARCHALFRRRYADILSEATRVPDQLGLLQCKLDELSGEEEPPFRALLALSSDRAEKQVYGNVEHPSKLGRLAKVFANVCR